MPCKAGQLLVQEVSYTNVVQVDKPWIRNVTETFWRYPQVPEKHYMNVAAWTLMRQKVYFVVPEAFVLGSWLAALIPTVIEEALDRHDVQIIIEDEVVKIGAHFRCGRVAWVD